MSFQFPYFFSVKRNSSLIRAADREKGFFLVLLLICEGAFHSERFKPSHKLAATSAARRVEGNPPLLFDGFSAI